MNNEQTSWNVWIDIKQSFFMNGNKNRWKILKKERTIVGTILKNYNFFTERKNFPKEFEKLTIFSNTIFKTTIFLTDS